MNQCECVSMGVCIKELITILSCHPERAIISKYIADTWPIRKIINRLCHQRWYRKVKCRPLAHGLHLSSINVSVWAACTARPRHGVQNHVISSSVSMAYLTSDIISAQLMHIHITHRSQQIRLDTAILHLSHCSLVSSELVGFFDPLPVDFSLSFSFPGPGVIVINIPYLVLVV